MATGLGQGCGIGGASPPPAAHFQPAPDFDAAEWMESITALGAKYAVYVAKHECGFTTWPTKVKVPDGSTYPYAVGGPDGATTVDVVGSFVRACKAAGVKPGFYYSLGSPLENVFLNSLQLTAEQILTISLQQLEELWDPARVGALAEVWFDGGWAGFKANVTALLAKLQPTAMAFNGCDPTLGCVGPPGGGNSRWIGTEAGIAPDPTWSTGVSYGAGNPNSTVWDPAECDTTLQNGDNWFYDPSAGLRSLSELVNVYHATVGRNGNLLLDIAPMPNGSIPADAKLRYAELGGWIRACYGKPPAVTGVLAGGARTLTLTLPAASGSGGVVDRVVLGEALVDGELVRGFTLEVESAGAWAVVESKQQVGHKRITLLPSGVAAATAVRVNVTATLNDLPPSVTVAALGGGGCQTTVPCSAAVSGQPIAGTTCTTDSVRGNQAWELEILARKAGIGGTDVVRLRMVGTAMCLAVGGPPGPGEFSNGTVVRPCNNDTWADPFDPGAEQRFSYDRTGKLPVEGPWGVLWEGDGTAAGLPGCLAVGTAPGFYEHLLVHPTTFSPMKSCAALPFSRFKWVAGPEANVSTLQYPDDGHGSGPLCLGACGSVPACRCVCARAAPLLCHLAACICTQFQAVRMPGIPIAPGVRSFVRTAGFSRSRGPLGGLVPSRASVCISCANASDV